jgi:UDP-N-acetyl-D-glucosamine dehydrogenase
MEYPAMMPEPVTAPAADARVATAPTAGPQSLHGTLRESAAVLGSRLSPNAAGPLDELAEKLRTRHAHVVIIGLGYVGLPLAVSLAQVGFRVTGLEMDVDRVDQLNQGVSYIPDIPSEQVAAEVAADRLQATNDARVIAIADAVLITVPTPYTKTKQPDMTYVLRASTDVYENLHPGMLVVLESTTYPGTTSELVQPILEQRGLRAGVDFALAYSPERIDPGSRNFDLRSTPKIVGGTTPEATDLAATLYEPVVERVVKVSNPKVAEMAKLMENTFRHVNIALANEMAVLAGKMDIDIWEVIEAAATKPFGYMPFFPGPGVGGHCIPIDPYYFAWKAQEHEGYARLIELAGMINDQMPEYVVERVADGLNDHGKSLRGSHVLVLGVAYKKDVPDCRESPALKVIERLLRKGALVDYHDPHVPELSPGHHGSSLTPMLSVELTPEVLRRADCVVVLTDHSGIDWEQVAGESSLVLDTRNALKQYRRPNVVRL